MTTTIVFPDVKAFSDLLVHNRSGNVCRWKTNDPNHVGDWPQKPIFTEIGSAILVPCSCGRTGCMQNILVQPKKQLRQWAKKHLQPGERARYMLEPNEDGTAKLILQADRLTCNAWTLAIVGTDTVPVPPR